MENWDNMRFLLALYRHKTMSAAAIALNTNVATVSRRVERASQIFGMPLFIKDSAGWMPTEAALPLLHVAEEFDARLTSERNNRAATERRGIEARVQIAAPAFFNTMVLLPQLASLLSDHRRLEIDIRNRGDATGLGDSDVMLRHGRPESGRVVARRLATLIYRGYRSNLSELRLPGWIALDARATISPAMALGQRIFGTEPSVTVSQFEQKLMLMRSTGKAAVLIEAVAMQLSDMAPVDPDGPSAESELWMVYHATRREDPAIKVVTDWIVTCFRSGRFGSVAAGEDLLDLAG